MPRSTALLSRPAFLRKAFPRLAAVALAANLLGGCAVVSVASATVGIAATGAGLAVDAAVGTARAVGSVAGAVLP